MITDEPSILDGDDITATILQVLSTVALLELNADEVVMRTARSTHFMPERPAPATALTAHASALNLSGRRYLIVEDDYLIASALTVVLETAGATVFGPVSDIDRASEIAAQTSFVLDAAILDINLNGKLVYPVAKQFLRRGTPVVFVTGYDRGSLQAEFAHSPCLVKPYDDAILIKTISDIQGQPLA
jgi:CheY-like chemotaxis protein